jgi:F-type H+-transporting ATPase subunit b
VWLMKRFLYQPVLDAIAAREQKIADELADAASTKTKAHQQQAEFEKKNHDFDEQRAAMLSEAKEAAKVERERLQVQAREAADAASAQRAKAQLAEAQQLHAEIAQQTQQQVFDISRRALGDLAGVSLEQRVCEVFIDRLQAIEGPALEKLGAALKGASDAEPALLRSAFKLPDPQRAAIQTALDKSFGQTIPLKFETTPELVSGIELTAQGQKLAWSISDYLSALSSDLEAKLGAAEPA